MKTSNVPDIVNSENIRFIDDNNIPIIFCEESNFKFNKTSSFRNPSFFIDNFEKNKFEIVDIRRIGVSDLSRLSYRLVSIDVRGKKNIRNFPGQKTSYMLKRRDDSLQGASEATRIPKDHFLEFDVENRRIRIKGRNTYPYIKNENASRWIDLNED